jgi:hypothetical protein
VKLTTPRHRTSRAVAALVVLVACAFTALAVTGPAAASTPCGKKVLADWFDNGRIDRLYPLHCYEDAIDAIPKDLRDYANAEEVISRALQMALRGQLDEGGPDPSPNGDGRTPSGPSAPTDPGEPVAMPDVDPSGPSSVPIPLLVLGGMSVALLAAGGLGYVSRRRHAGDEPDDLL